jgi:hypothetical protein
MSRALTSRLSRPEAATGPKVLGYWHAIYARDGADYEAQRAGLIASGRAKPDQFCVEVWLAETDVPREPETFPETRTHEEWVDILARPECQQ